MKKTITKKQIIAAIEGNELEQGRWFHTNFFWDVEATCKVCAVGAIVRSVIKPDGYMSQVASRIGFSFSKGWKSHLMNKEYLPALSSYFESMKKVSKPRLIKWVEKNFPNKITVEY